MHQSMDDMMEQMKQKNGEEFDQAFLEAMIIHHRQAIEMTAMARDRASNPRLKEMAAEMNQKQQAEINEMETMRRRVQ